MDLPSEMKSHKMRSWIMESITSNVVSNKSDSHFSLEIQEIKSLNTPGNKLKYIKRLHQLALYQKDHKT